MKGMKLIASLAVVGTLSLAAGTFAWYQPDKTVKDSIKGVKDTVKGAKDAVKDAKDAVKGQPADPMMEAMMKAATPGEEHKRMAKMVGMWDTAAKFNMPGPDGKMMEMASKGECKITSELGDRWFRQDYKGDMMGQPFTGFGYWGYDNIDKKFIGTWADSMSTGMMYMTGTYDATKKEMTMTGDMTDPMTGVKCHCRYVTIHTDDDHFTFVMYHSEPGKAEAKDGEIVYTRRK